MMRRRKKVIPVLHFSILIIFVLLLAGSIWGFMEIDRTSTALVREFDDACQEKGWANFDAIESSGTYHLLRCYSLDGSHEIITYVSTMTQPMYVRLIAFFCPITLFIYIMGIASVMMGDD